MIVSAFHRIAHAIRWRLIGERHVAAYYSFKRSQKKRGSVWFYPDPAIGYSISKVCAELGLRIATSPDSDTRLGVLWKDSTYVDASPPTGLRFLNALCTDISKSRVQLEFERAFGYSLAIDPLTFSGPAVSKSDSNFAHDGKIVRCPIDASEPERVYEIVVNNEVRPDVIEDIRLPIVGKTIPFAYLKQRPKHRRFENINRSVVRVPVRDVISAHEVECALNMASAMGLDWGELDAMRDLDSGKLYIVDVNKTPGGPPVRMPFFQKLRAVKLLANAFQSEFLSPNTAR